MQNIPSSIFRQVKDFQGYGTYQNKHYQMLIGAVFNTTVTQNPHVGLVNWQFHYRDPNAKGKGNVNCTDASDPRRNDAATCGASHGAKLLGIRETTVSVGIQTGGRQSLSRRFRVEFLAGAPFRPAHDWNEPLLHSSPKSLGCCTPEQIEGTFRDAFILLERRISLFLALPISSLDKLAIQKHIDKIGHQ